MKRNLSIVTLIGLNAAVAGMAADVSFESEVWPIFEARCVECHRKPYEEDGKLKKPKAGLRMDGAWHIMKGSDDGPIVVPERKDASTLLYHISLPADDDDIMPPKGDPLTKEQIRVIGLWIEEGARFDGWEGATDGVVKVEPKVYAEPSFVKAFKSLEKGLTPVPDKVLSQVSKKSGATIRRLHPDSPLVDVGFFTTPNELGDDAVKALAPLRNHITKLSLARMVISDVCLKEVGKYKKLSYLNLKETPVTDAGISELAGLRGLVSLNLYRTKVTDKGISSLKKCKSLRKLYVAGTDVTEAGVKELGQALPGVYVSTGF